MERSMRHRSTKGSEGTLEIIGQFPGMGVAIGRVLGGYLGTLARGALA